MKFTIVIASLLAITQAIKIGEESTTSMVDLAELSLEDNIEVLGQ